MKIAEIYQSLQGEGLLAGTASVFVRTSGCNLRCAWCDTPFTSWEPVGNDIDVNDIVATVESFGRRHVVITGGEPLLQAAAIDLCQALRKGGHHVTVETAGTVLPDRAAAGRWVDLVSISPKLASSGPPASTSGGWARRHAEARRRDHILEKLMVLGPWQLKFVIDTPADLEETAAWLDDLGISAASGPVFMMPQGTSDAELTDRASWLATACRERGYRLALRHHVSWFGHTRGT